MMMEESMLASTVVATPTTKSIINNSIDQPLSIVDQWRTNDSVTMVPTSTPVDTLATTTTIDSQSLMKHDSNSDEDGADIDEEEEEEIDDNNLIKSQESLKPLVSTTTETPPPPASLPLPGSMMVAPSLLPLPHHPYPHPMLMMKMMMMNMEQQQQQQQQFNHLNQVVKFGGQFDLLPPPHPQLSSPLSSLIAIHNKNGDQNLFGPPIHQSPDHITQLPHAQLNFENSTSVPATSATSSLLTAAIESNPALLQYFAAANASSQCSPISLAASVAAAVAASAANNNKLRTDSENNEPAVQQQSQPAARAPRSRSNRNGGRKVFSTNRRLVQSTVTAPRYLNNNNNGSTPSLEPGKPSENPIYRCHLCPYTGNSKLQFNAHMNTHFDHRCPHCDYTSRTEGRLKRHIRDFHSETPPETWSGNRIKSEDGSIDIDLAAFMDDDGMSAGGNGPNPARNRKYRCKQCGYVAVAKHDFWEHTRGHIKSDKMLSCPKCNFVTEYKHHLEYHLRNHFGSKPFKCAKCNYSCVNKSMLNSHMKSHSNIYQYRCEDCTYATKYCHSLKLHLRKYQHRPATVLNLDGTPNPYPVIDVYGTRRGPRPKRNLGPRAGGGSGRSRRQRQTLPGEQHLNQAEQDDEMMMHFDEEEEIMEQEVEIGEYIPGRSEGDNAAEMNNDQFNGSGKITPTGTRVSLSPTRMQLSADQQNQSPSSSCLTSTSTSTSSLTTSSLGSSSSISSPSSSSPSTASITNKQTSAINQPISQPQSQINSISIQSKSTNTINNSGNKSTSQTTPSTTTTTTTLNILRCNYCPFQTESKPDFANHLLNHVMNEKISSMMKMKNTTTSSSSSGKVSTINNQSRDQNLQPPPIVHSTCTEQQSPKNSWPFPGMVQTTPPPQPPAPSQQSVLPPMINPQNLMIGNRILQLQEPNQNQFCRNLNCSAPIDGSIVEESSFGSNTFREHPARTDPTEVVSSSQQQQSQQQTQLVQIPLDLSGKVNQNQQATEIFESPNSQSMDPIPEVDTQQNGESCSVSPPDGGPLLLNPAPNGNNATTISALLLMNSFLLNAQRNLKEVLENGGAAASDGAITNYQPSTPPPLAAESKSLYQITKSLSPIVCCEQQQMSPPMLPPTPTPIDRPSHNKRKGRANRVDLSQLMLNSFDSDQEDIEDDDEDLLTESKYPAEVFEDISKQQHRSSSATSQYGPFQIEDNDDVEDYDNRSNSTGSSSLTTSKLNSNCCFESEDLEELEDEEEEEEEENSKLTKLSNEEDRDMDQMFITTSNTESLIPQLHHHQLPPTPTKSPKNPFDFSDPRLLGPIPSTPTTGQQLQADSGTSNLQSNTNALSQLFMQILQHQQSSGDINHHRSSNNNSPNFLNPPSPGTALEETNSLINKMYSATSLMQEILVEMCQVKK